MASALFLLLTLPALCHRLGWFFLRRVHDLSPAELFLVRCCLGFALLSAGSFLLLALELYDGKLLCLGYYLVGTFSLAAAVPNIVRQRWRPSRTELVLLGILGFMLLGALTPELDRDSLVYHSAVPAQYLLHGGFLPLPGNHFAAFPMNVELVYCLALAVAGVVGPKIVGFLCFLALVLLTRCCTRQLLGGKPGLEGLLLVTTPTLFFLGLSSYIDQTVALFLGLSLHLLLRWREEDGPAKLVLAGLCGAFAMGSKYQAVVWPAVLCGFYVRDLAAGRPRRHHLLVLVLACLGLVPWLVRNQAVYGNPVFPFLYDLFGGSGWDAERAGLYARHLFTYGLPDAAGDRDLVYFLTLPLRLSFQASFDSKLFDGVLGPWWLLSAPFLLVAWWRSHSPHKVPLALFSAMFFCAWAATSNQLRFLVPLVPLSAAASAVLLQRSRGLMLGILLACLLGATTYNIWAIQERVRSRGLVEFYLEDRGDHDAFLSRRLAVYPLYRYLSATLPREARVYLVGTRGYSLYLDRPALTDTFLDTWSFEQWLVHLTPEAVLGALRERGCSHLVLDHRALFGAKPYHDAADLERLSRLAEAFSVLEERYLVPLLASGSLRAYRLEELHK